MLRSLIKRVLGRSEESVKPATPKPYPFKYEPQPEAQAAPQVQPEVEAAPEEAAPEVTASPEPEVAPEPQVEAAPVAETPAEPEEEALPVEYWTVKQLRAELEALGVPLKSKMRKAELVELMQAQQAAGSEVEEAPAASGLSHAVVQELLDDMVRPALQADGGDITLVKVEGNDVHVALVGACSTCPSSIMTMKLGVEALFREEFPDFGNLIEVNGVV